jgi:hypothetical protein
LGADKKQIVSGFISSSCFEKTNFKRQQYWADLLCKAACLDEGIGKAEENLPLLVWAPIEISATLGRLL